MIRKAFAALVAWFCRHDGEAVYADVVTEDAQPPGVFCTSVRVLPAHPPGSKLLVLSDGRRSYVALLCECQAPLVALDMWPARSRAFSTN